MIEIIDIELIKKFNVKYENYFAIVSFDIRVGCYSFDLFDEKLIRVDSLHGTSISDQNIINRIVIAVNKRLRPI